MGSADRHPDRVGRAADEALVHACPVHVRPPNRVGEIVGPVEAGDRSQHAAVGRVRDAITRVLKRSPTGSDEVLPSTLLAELRVRRISTVGGHSRRAGAKRET